MRNAYKATLAEQVTKKDEKLQSIGYEKYLEEQGK